MANNEVMNAQPEILGKLDVTKSYLYEELWKLCAGHFADVPTMGSKVYYFPQGHVEHLKASTKEDMDMIKPLFDLPTKLRCNVMNIQLEVEKDTDVVYAKISLIPDINGINIPIPNGNQPRPIIYSFTKVLTASDSSTHSGFSIPRKHAIDCLPPLDMTQQPPTHDLVTEDLHGYEWRFKHVFRGTPRKHLFTTGWNTFATAKRLIAGDSLVFVRGENGELRIGIRRSTHQQCNISSIISTECMHHGVIASTMHAIRNNCMFTVIYKPRISQFVINFDKYVDAVNNNFNVGSRFKMHFEGEDFTEIRYFGTVVGVKDISPHWKNSEWRSLEVQWDDPASIPRPDKVFPWEIEPLTPLLNISQSTLIKNKRFRQINEIGSTSSNPWVSTLPQDQVIGQSSMSPQICVPQLSDRYAIKDSKIPSGWPLRNYLVSTMTKQKNNDQMIIPTKEGINIDAVTSCRLFGVDMTMNPAETKDPMGPTDSYQKYKISKIYEEKKFDHNQTLTSTKEAESQQINSTRSRTKVQMQGVPIGRAVDLTLLDGYNSLIYELEKLFDLKGELRIHNRWKIVFTDNEGDMMLMGDDPWPEFCNMVKKIFIYSKKEFEKMKSRNKLSKGESTILTCFGVPPYVKNLNNNLSN